MAFSMAAEIERDLISKRTREALAAKKKQGIQLGRPKGTGKSKLDAYRPEIEAYLLMGQRRSSSPLATKRAKQTCLDGLNAIG